MNRRDLLLAGGALLGAGSLPLGAFAGCLGRADAAEASDLKARFAACLGSEFQLTGADGERRRLRLLALDQEASCPGIEQFSVLWEGAAPAPLAAGSYQVSHPQAGEHRLHLEPGPAQPGQARLRACFSLLV